MTLRRPEDFRHHDADLDSIRLHYLREGRGPALLLVHGWPGFCWEWHRNIGPLGRRFDVIAPDMRGFGDSEKPPLERTELFHTDHVVADFVALLDALGIEHCFVVGHDYGSEVAHKLIRRHRDRIEKALIINPSAPGWEERYLSRQHFHESWYAMFHRLHMAAELVGSSREAVRLYYRHFLSHWSANKDLFSAEEIEVYVDNFMKPGNIEGGFNFYKTDEPWSDVDYTVSDCPVAFLQGTEDPIAPPDWLDLVTRWYTDYTVEFVMNAGHFVMREQAELVNDRIARFFLG